MKSKVIKLNRVFWVKSIMVCLFLLYTLMVIDFTLINNSFGRSISNIFLADKGKIAEYFSEKTNIVPFATVRLFVNAYKTDSLDTFVVLENILGNLLVLMPFAFFVPNVFKKINSVLKFLGVISIFVLLIEVLQLIFLTGSADIDDFILNVSGAMIAYGVLGITKVNIRTNKFLCGETCET